MRKKMMLALLLLNALVSSAQNNPLWLRYPSISPDGKTIVFGYKGDLYSVAATGGNAVPLTVHEAHDFMPVWSRDGKWLAFASDRNGNFDVYIMPATGGEARRLTFHSANDFPYDFSVDGKYVLFGTNRNDIYSSARFPVRSVFQKLYQVPAQGGRSVMINSAGTEFAHYNNKGDKIIFQDRKGYEDAFRKHHTSSVTRDIWIYDIKKDEYSKVSDFEGEDREPVWGVDDHTYYYLSEKNGSQNLFKVANGKTEQLTNYKDHPVRNLSRSNDGAFCFTYKGEIFTMQEGAAPQKVKIAIHADTRGKEEKIFPVNKDITQAVVSPNGKEIAVVVRGEVFVTSVEYGITKRITNTPQQERSVSFSPDGRTIYYASERGNSWDIYKAGIQRKDEPYFYAATAIAEEAVITTAADEFQPEVSPDGKQLAYLEERTTIKIADLSSKKMKTVLPAGINYSYADGDQYFKWSPDGKWLATNYSEGRWPSIDVAIINVSDGKRINISNSGFFDIQPKWAFGGKAMLWASDRDGKLPLATQGQRELDLYAVFFDQEAYDKFKLTKDEYALEKDIEELDKKDSSKKIAPPTKDWELSTDNFENRKMRLTLNSVSASDYILSSDGEKLFFVAKTDKTYDLWMLNLRTKETKMLAKLGEAPGNLDMSKDGKNLFVVSDGRVSKVDAESGVVTPIQVNGEMVLNTDEERRYIFEHCWRQVSKKFYDPKIHGIDWKMYHDVYLQFLPHVSNNYEFQELLSEMLGELNASHTGGRYTVPQQNMDATASLGVLTDETYNGKGIKVMEVIPGGPLMNSKTKISKGIIIEKINREDIGNSRDWNAMLNRQAGKSILLTLINPQSGERWEETIKPITQTQESGLLYKRWVENNRKKVHELSGGKLGYVHVEGMNDASFRTVFEQALGKESGKLALIVDTRFNGGGNLHDDLANFLAGKKYMQMAPRSEMIGTVIPRSRWTKPSVVVMSESNYSDAHLFPYAYKSVVGGKLIGMPVPGTGTAVWWETQIDPTMVFGIPQVAFIGKENRPLENLQMEPDIKVVNDLKEILKGNDQQLEKAVQVLLEEIKK